MDERRTHERWPAEWLVRLWLNDNCYLGASTVDVSLRGSRLHLTGVPGRTLRLGQAYRLEFRSGPTQTHVCTAHVRHLSERSVGLEVADGLPPTIIARHAGIPPGIGGVAASRADAGVASGGSQAGRILVVDDDPDVADTIEEYLEPRGYEVGRVSDADGAMEVLASHPPHLVLLDVDLPGTNGLEALGQIRDRHPSIGVIIITGYQDPRLAQATLELGALNFLLKPFDLERLDRVIRWNMRRILRPSAAAESAFVVSRSGSVTIVTSRDDLDMNTAEELQRTLAALVADGAGARVVIDLDAVSYLDSVGLGVLVAATKAARASGGDLKLCGIRAGVRSILDLTGLAKHLSLYADSREAGAAFN